MVSFFCFSLLFGEELEQLWRALNVFQITQNSKLFGTKTPGNFNSFVKYSKQVTDLELFDISQDIQDQIYIPEVESFSLNF